VGIGLELGDLPGVPECREIEISLYHADHDIANPGLPFIDGGKTAERGCLDDVEDLYSRA